MFALILTPLLFTGASQYPWTSLDQLRWFQVVTALNPLTYVSEGMRAALEPAVPHIPPWISVLVLAAALTAFTVVGIRLFLRRAIDYQGAKGAARQARGQGKGQGEPRVDDTTPEEEGKKRKNGFLVSEGWGRGGTKAGECGVGTRMWG